MQSEMRPLGEFVTLVSGNTPSKANPAYWGSGTPWVSAKDMGDFWIEDAEDHLTDAGVAVASRLMPPGSVLLLARGMTLHKRVPICRVARASTFNQDVKAVLPKAGLSSRFLPYLLVGNHDRLHERVDSAGHGTGRLNTNELLSFPVVVPSFSEQEGIADIGEAIDERLRLLRQTNATLESIAQALFKSWFIDFDPVRAKAEGREPEGMDASTAALFPAEFEESALGLIPKGWGACSVANLCARVTNGATPSRSNPSFWQDGTIPWFKTGELFDSHLLDATERISRQAVEKTNVKVLPRHAVLMAIYAAPTVGRLGILTSEAAFNQACTGMVALPEVGPWYLFQSLFHGREWFNSRANGAAQQNISKAIVESYQCVRPCANVLRAFNETAGTLYASAEKNALQAQVLVKLRDTLLPRLISGKLRLPEAETAIEAVA